MMGMKCYSCGEYDVIEVVHHNHDSDMTVCQEQFGCHGVCSNCDYGTCALCNT